MKIRPKIILIVVLIILLLGGAAYGGVWLAKTKTPDEPQVAFDFGNNKNPAIIPGIPIPDDPSKCQFPFSAPVDPSKYIKDQYDQYFVRDQLYVTFFDGTDCNTVKKVISKVRGKILASSPEPVATYQIELPVSSIEELEEAMKILKAYNHVDIVRKIFPIYLDEIR
jgi:hypothetical protein